MAIPYLACMALVARLYALPPRVLPSIQAVEGGRAGLVHPNSDGSEDYGVMQINSRWVAPLARAARLSSAETRLRLIEQPCFNIAAAGLIMHTYLTEANGDLLRAVGYYHSHTPAYGAPYRLRVISAATRLFVASAAAPPETAPPAPGTAPPRTTPPRTTPPRTQPARTRAPLGRHQPAGLRLVRHRTVS